MDLLSKLNQIPAERRTYLLQSLPSHLASGKEWQRLQQLLWSGAFLVEKIRVTSTNALLQDLDYLDDPDITTLKRALQSAAYILDEDANQLRSQIIARIWQHERQTEKWQTLLDELSTITPDIQLQLERASLHQYGLENVYEHNTNLNSGIVIRNRNKFIGLHSNRTNSPAQSGINNDSLTNIFNTNTQAISLWDIDTLRIEHYIQLPTWEHQRRASMSPFVTQDGHYLILSEHAQAYRNAPIYHRTSVLNLRMGTYLYNFDDYKDISFAPNRSDIIFSKVDNYQIEFWNIHNGETLGHVTFEEKIKSYRITNDGNHIVVRAANDSIQARHIITGALHFQYDDIEYYKIEMIPNTSYLLCIGHGKNLDYAIASKQRIKRTQRAKIIDTKTGEILQQHRLKMLYPSYIIQADGQRLLISNDNRATIWEAQSNTFTDIKVKDYYLGFGGTTHLFATRELAMLNANGPKFLDLTSGNIISSPQLQRMNITFVSDDEKSLYAINPNTIVQWDLDELLQSVDEVSHHEDSTFTPMHSKAPSKIVPLPQKNLLFSLGALDKKILQWHLRDNTTFQVYEGHNNRVLGLDYHADTQLVVSSQGGTFNNSHPYDMHNATIHLWDANTGQQLDVVERHTYSVPHVIFVNGGQNVLSASGDGSIILWQINQQRLEQTQSEQQSNKITWFKRIQTALLPNSNVLEFVKDIRDAGKFKVDGGYIVPGAAVSYVGAILFMKRAPDQQTIIFGVQEKDGSSLRTMHWDGTNEQIISEFPYLIKDLTYHPSNQIYFAITNPARGANFHLHHLQWQHNKLHYKGELDLGYRGYGANGIILSDNVPFYLIWKSSYTKKLLCYDLETHDLQWERDVPDIADITLFEQPQVTYLIFCIGTECRVVLLENGELVARHFFDERLQRCAVVNEKIIVFDSSGRGHILELST